MTSKSSIDRAESSPLLTGRQERQNFQQLQPRFQTIESKKKTHSLQNNSLLLKLLFKSGQISDEMAILSLGGEQSPLSQPIGFSPDLSLKSMADLDKILGAPTVPH